MKGCLVKGCFVFVILVIVGVYTIYNYSGKVALEAMAQTLTQNTETYCQAVVHNEAMAKKIRATAKETAAFLRKGEASSISILKGVVHTLREFDNSCVLLVLYNEYAPKDDKQKTPGLGTDSVALAPESSEKLKKVIYNVYSGNLDIKKILPLEVALNQQVKTNRIEQGVFNGFRVMRLNGAEREKLLKMAFGYIDESKLKEIPDDFTVDDFAYKVFMESVVPYTGKILFNYDDVKKFHDAPASDAEAEAEAEAE